MVGGVHCARTTEMLWGSEGPVVEPALEHFKNFQKFELFEIFKEFCFVLQKEPIFSPSSRVSKFEEDWFCRKLKCCENGSLRRICFANMVLERRTCRLSVFT